MKVIWWGHKKFEEILQLQMQSWQSVCDNPTEPIILAGTHPAVVTLGLRGTEADIANFQSDLPVVRCDRGGQATLHSEGQLVVYPILPLNELQLGVKDLVCLIESTVKKTLQGYDVEILNCSEAGQSGVFTPGGKIMSLGLRVQHGVSRHGMAVNISNDLSLFQSIKACGVASRSMDKLEYWAEGITPENFFKSWLEVFVQDLTSRSPYSNFCISANGSVGAVGSAFP